MSNASESPQVLNHRIDIRVRQRQVIDLGHIGDCVAQFVELAVVKKQGVVPDVDQGRGLEFAGGAFGAFFYFPGYSFGVGFGTGHTYGHFGHFGHGYSGYAYFPYGHVSYVGSSSFADPYTGFLRLKVRPRDAEVFVNGFYVGVVDEFDGIFQRLRLEEGTHHIEIRHPAYLPLELEVLIVTGEKVTYEGRHEPR